MGRMKALLLPMTAPPHESKVPLLEDDAYSWLAQAASPRLVWILRRRIGLVLIHACLTFGACPSPWVSLQFMRSRPSAAHSSTRQSLHPSKGRMRGRTSASDSPFERPSLWHFATRRSRSPPVLARQHWEESLLRTRYHTSVRFCLVCMVCCRELAPGKERVRYIGRHTPLQWCDK
jgi:hypothetical protein